MAHGSRGGAGYGGFSKPRGYQSNLDGGYGSQRGSYSNGTRDAQAGYLQAQQTQHRGQGHYGYEVSGSAYRQNDSGNARQISSGQSLGYNGSVAVPTPTSDVPASIGQENEQMERGGPVLMGPPIRMGFDNRPSVISGQTSTPSCRNAPHQDRGRPTSFTRGGQDPKRVYGDAYGSRRIVRARPMAPPAVPAFGSPFVAVSSEGPKLGQMPKKKKRKHNQLGLTPKTEDHESSEEEDIDEESKLASMQLSDTNSALQFTYKGQIATLNSPSDIAAWIEERKKRFPTKKRAEEAAERKEQQKKAAQETKELQKKEWKKTKASEYKTRTGSDVAATAKMKAEKLRKQYEKAQKRVAKIEAEANATENPILAGQERSLKPTPSVTGEHGPTRHAVKSSSIHSITNQHKPLSLQELERPHKGTAPPEGTPSTVLTSSENLAEPPKLIVPDPESLTPTSQLLTPVSKAHLPLGEDLLGVEFRSPGQPNDGLQADLQSIPSDKSGLIEEVDDFLSSDNSDLPFSDEDSYTSSSGSSSDDNTPLETTSRHNGPEPVPPIRFRKQNAICNAFLAKGRCIRGDKCKYRHELPERGSGSLAKESRKPSRPEDGAPRIERLSLYQRVSISILSSLI